MRTKYDADTIMIMSSFEKITRAKLKDCFMNRDRMVFVVENGYLGAALGRNKENVDRLEKALNRKIKIMEFNPDVLIFVKNLLYPLRALSIEGDSGIITIKGPDTKTKGLMIGAKAQNLRNYEEIVQKYFSEIKELKVI